MRSLIISGENKAGFPVAKEGSKVHDTGSTQQACLKISIGKAVFLIRVRLEEVCRYLRLKMFREKQKFKCLLGDKCK